MHLGIPHSIHIGNIAGNFQDPYLRRHFSVLADMDNESTCRPLKERHMPISRIAVLLGIHWLGVLQNMPNRFGIVIGKNGHLDFLLNVFSWLYYEKTAAVLAEI